MDGGIWVRNGRFSWLECSLGALRADTGCTFGGEVTVACQLWWEFGFSEAMESPGGSCGVSLAGICIVWSSLKLWYRGCVRSTGRTEMREVLWWPGAGREQKGMQTCMVVGAWDQQCLRSPGHGYGRGRSGLPLGPCEWTGGPCGPPVQTGRQARGRVCRLTSQSWSRGRASGSPPSRSLGCLGAEVADLGCSCFGDIAQHLDVTWS